MLEVTLKSSVLIPGRSVSATCRILPTVYIFCLELLLDCGFFPSWKVLDKVIRLCAYAWITSESFGNLQETSVIYEKNRASFTQETR